MPPKKKAEEIELTDDKIIEFLTTKKTGTVGRPEFEELKAIVNFVYNKLKDENEILKNKITKLEKNTPSTNFDSWATVVKAKAKPKAQLNVMNAMTIELEEKKKRAKNIIIVGIPESKVEEEEKVEDDKKTVEKILNDIGVNIQTSYIKRLKSRKNDKPGPILLELKEAADRNVVLKAAQKLRENINTKAIFFNPDLTEAERLLDYQLRKERKNLNEKLDSSSPFRYGIRGNQIVKIKRN